MPRQGYNSMKTFIAMIVTQRAQSFFSSSVLRYVYHLTYIGPQLIGMIASKSKNGMELSFPNYQ